VDLVTREPPADLPYDQLEDWHNRALLDGNGVGTAVAEVLAALQGDDAQLRPVAAHELGRLREQTAVPALMEAAGSDDDHLAVEAAYALARMGRMERGRSTLRELVRGDITASTVPLVAAGYLARLGDGCGLAVVEDGLRSPNFLVRIAAAKQLSWFLPIDEPRTRALFDQAAHDEEEDVRWAVEYQRKGA
jgi:HEAT repeat protein